MEYHRHTVVNLGDEGIGLRGEDGEGRLHGALCIVHGAPDPGKGKWFFGSQGNAVGHLALTSAFPLIEAISQDQTAFVLEGLPKERLGRHGLGAENELCSHPVLFDFVSPQTHA